MSWSVTVCCLSKQMLVMWWGASWAYLTGQKSVQPNGAVNVGDRICNEKFEPWSLDLQNKLILLFVPNLWILSLCVQEKFLSSFAGLFPMEPARIGQWVSSSVSTNLSQIATSKCWERRGKWNQDSEAAAMCNVLIAVNAGIRVAYDFWGEILLRFLHYMCLEDWVSTAFWCYECSDDWIFTTIPLALHVFGRLSVYYGLLCHGHKCHRTKAPVILALCVIGWLDILRFITAWV